MMGILSCMYSIVRFGHYYDFSRCDFYPPYQGELEVKLDQAETDDLVYTVCDDISEKLALGRRPIKNKNEIEVWSLHPVQIILSNDEPPKKYYKGLSAWDIEKIIDKHIKDSRLSDREKDLLKRIAKKMRDGEYFPEEHDDFDVSDLCRRIIADIKRAWSSRDYVGITSGVFQKNTNGPHKIIIYMKAFVDKYISKGMTAAELYLNSVLAHEIFHYYHCTDPLLCERWSCSKPNDIPIESLASYYEYTCDSEDVQMQVELIHEWMSHDMNVWPYSGAEYLIPNVNYVRSINKRDIGGPRFSRVYEDSLIGMKYAYEDLIVFRKHKEDRAFFADMGL